MRHRWHCLYRLTLCGYTFDPPTIHVRSGDTVHWQFEPGGTHSTTSGACSFPNPCVPDGLWDSGPLNGPAAFWRTFVQPGTYHYYCGPGHPFDHATIHEGGFVVVDP